MNEENNWIVCKAQTADPCWSELFLMLELSPELEKTWCDSLRAFDQANRIVALRELQVECLLYLLEYDDDLSSATEGCLTELIQRLEISEEWLVITSAQAEELCNICQAIPFNNNRLTIQEPLYGDTIPFTTIVCRPKYATTDVYADHNLSLPLLKTFGVPLGNPPFTYTVEVSGCNAEQAHEVMQDRMGCQDPVKTRGFEYSLNYYC
jgi:hypothetical protein